jgi:hypothetical protein
MRAQQLPIPPADPPTPFPGDPVPGPDPDPDPNEPGDPTEPSKPMRPPLNSGHAEAASLGRPDAIPAELGQAASGRTP